MCIKHYLAVTVSSHCSKQLMVERHEEDDEVILVDNYLMCSTVYEACGIRDFSLKTQEVWRELATYVSLVLKPSLSTT